MKKYIQLLKYEAKTIIRDPFQLYLTAFPFILMLLAVFLFPVIFHSMNPADESTLRITTLVLIMVILTFGNFLVGAMGSFQLLEHKDEHTIATIAVTPIGTSGYLLFKMTYIYVLSVLNIILVLLGIKLFASNEYIVGGLYVFDAISILQIVFYALVSALFAPALALLQGAFAKNKVEGFAFVKGSGIVAMIPIIMLLDAFKGGLQYVLGIFPNFWAIKGFMLELLPNASNANMSFAMYLIIGAVYNILIFAVAYKLFLKKVQY